MISKDNYKLIEKNQKKIVYKIEDWILSIVSYTKELNVKDKTSYFVLVEPLIDKSITILCYPETGKIFYRLSTNVLSEERLSELIKDLQKRQEMVNTIKDILKKETEINYE